MSGLILVLVFVLAGTIAYLVLAPSGETLLVKKRAQAIRRQAGFIVQEDGTLMDEEMALPFAQRVISPIIEGFSGWAMKSAPDKMRANFELKLMQAGNPLSPGHFWLIKTAATGGLGLLALLLGSPNFNRSPATVIMLVVVFMFLGWRLPEFWLARKITTRGQLINQALPDVLDLLSVSVEAGLGLDGAIQKVGEKFPEPTAGEFRELLKEIRLGSPRVDALRAMADRTGLPDVRTFTAAVIQAEQLGVSIARVLRAQSDALRVKRRQKAEEKAMALPVKMIFPMIVFIFPTIFIVVLGPVVLSLIGGLGK